MLNDMVDHTTTLMFVVLSLMVATRSACRDAHLRSHDGDGSDDNNVVGRCSHGNWKLKSTR